MFLFLTAPAGDVREVLQVLYRKIYFLKIARTCIEAGFFRQIVHTEKKICSQYHISEEKRATITHISEEFPCSFRSSW
jgi:hypothetical protein